MQFMGMDELELANKLKKLERFEEIELERVVQGLLLRQALAKKSDEWRRVSKEMRSLETAYEKFMQGGK